MLYINLDKKNILGDFSQTHLVTVNQMPEKQMKHKDNLWPRAHDTVWLDIKPEWKRSRCCCILTQVARNGKKNANTFCCLSERVDLSLGKPTGGRVEKIVYVHADKKQQNSCTREFVNATPPHNCTVSKLST
jgi:hypothetical protein